MLLSQYLPRPFLKPVFLRFILKFHLSKWKISTRFLFQMSHSFIHSFVLSTICPHVHPTAHCQKSMTGLKACNHRALPHVTSWVTLHLLRPSYIRICPLESRFQTIKFMLRSCCTLIPFLWACRYLQCFGNTLHICVWNWSRHFIVSYFAINHTYFRKGHVLNFVGRTWGSRYEYNIWHQAWSEWKKIIKFSPFLLYFRYDICFSPTSVHVTRELSDFASVCAGM